MAEMEDIAFTPVRGNINEIENTPLQDGQFLFTTESSGNNRVYADVLRADGTVERVGILGNYVSKNGDTVDGNMIFNGVTTFNGEIMVKTSMGTVVSSRKFFDYLYPIGSLYMTTANRSPSSMFGGSWQSKGYKDAIGGYIWERTS